MMRARGPAICNVMSRAVVVVSLCFRRGAAVASRLMSMAGARAAQWGSEIRRRCYCSCARASLACKKKGGAPGFGRLLPGELLRGYSVWGLPWGHKSAPQLFVGIGTSPHPYNGLILVPRPLKTLRWRGSPFLDAACAPCLPSCGGCGGAPAQAPHRLHEGAPTEHLMRAAHRTRTLNSAFFLKRQIVIRGR